MKYLILFGNRSLGYEADEHLNIINLMEAHLSYIKLIILKV